MIDNNMEFIDIFEQKISEYTGSKYAICTDCCTNAILISLYFLKCGFHISNKLIIPKRTYMSIPMTLKLFGFDIKLSDYCWNGWYSILNDDETNTGVVDAAVFFKENMWNEITIPNINQKFVCVSFQQKKRLNLGRGGAILTDDYESYKILKRLVYDGRNPKICDSEEISKNPNDILTGFHAYMEPEKAARGITIINQPIIMPKFKEITYLDYPDLGVLFE